MCKAGPADWSWWPHDAVVAAHNPGRRNKEIKMNQKVGGKGQHSPSFPVKGRLSSSIRFYKILKHYNKSRLKSDFVGKQLKT